MPKRISYEGNARNKLSKGVEKLSKAVKSTLGPAGRTVIIEKPFGPPTITKDGVTVAKECILEDQFEELGARIIREAATQTNESAGDGTTSATVLAEAILKRSMLAMERGVNPIKLKKGLEAARDAVIDHIKSEARDVKGYDEIKQVATISANNDEEIGKIIADAFKEVGEDGVITTEDGQSLETTLSFQQGMEIEKGFISPYFITDVTRGECVLEDPFIFIMAGKLNNVDEFVNIANHAKRKNRPLVLMADSFGEIVFKTALVNKVKGLFEAVLIENPAFGAEKIDGLKDIATVCGATLVDPTLEMKLDKDNFKEEWFGKAEKVTVTKSSTTIIGGKGGDEEMEERAKFLQKKIEESESEYQTESLRKRLAKLTGGVARINVGGATESEVIEKKMRIEDALYATKAASEEGIVPGGGSVFLRAWKKLSDSKNDVGYEAVVESLNIITKTIADNAGLPGDVIINTILSESDTATYDALNEGIVDGFEQGIVDPAKVCICALTTAVSVVGLLLTTNTAIVDKIEDKEQGYGSPGLPPHNL